MKTTLAGTTVGAVGGLLIAALAPPATAHAGTSTHVPCTARHGGAAGLVAAVRAANSHGGGVIELAPGCTYKLTAPDNSQPGIGGNGLPVITSRITIKGNCATISRNPASQTPFRIVEVSGPKGNLTLRDLRLTGGVAPFGGGIFNDEGTVTLDHTLVTRNTGQMGGGGIASGIGPDHPNDIGPLGTLTLHDSQVTDNSALPTGGGGGILNRAGTLTADHSQVSGNQSGNGGGIASGPGNGGVAGNSILRLKATEVNGNTATNALGGPGAGGIANGGSAVLDTTEVNGNRAPGGLGGGIVNHGTMTLNHSRVVGNSAPKDAKGNQGGGGGIFNANLGVPGSPIPNSGVLTINGSVISRNSTSGNGGGILNNIPGQLPATLTLNRSRVTDNTAHSGGGIFNAGGPVSLSHTVVSHNHPDNCKPTGSVPHCTG